MTGTLALMVCIVLAKWKGDWGALPEYLGFLNLVNLTPFPMMDGNKIFASLRESTAGISGTRLSTGLLLVSSVAIVTAAGLSITSVAVTLPFLVRMFRPGAQTPPPPERVPLSPRAVTGVCLTYMLCLVGSALASRH